MILLFKSAQHLLKLPCCVTCSGGGAALHLDIGSIRRLACMHSVNSCMHLALQACPIGRHTADSAPAAAASAVVIVAGNTPAASRAQGVS